MPRIVTTRALATALSCIFALGALGACGDDDGDSGGDGEGGGGGSAAGFCDDARGLEEQFTDFGEGEDFSDMSQFEEMRDVLGDIDAPDEISDDFETLRGGLDTMIQVFEDFDPEDPTSLEDLDLEELETIGSDLETASANIETYLEEECGIESSNGLDTDETGSDEDE